MGRGWPRKAELQTSPGLSPFSVAVLWVLMGQHVKWLPLRVPKGDTHFSNTFPL